MASSEQNKPWTPPDGSNNGSNKCWVNAPLYAILSNNEIRERVNNIEVPTEDELKGLSNALNLPTIDALKTALTVIDTLTDQDVPDIVTNIQICINLTNNDTLLNRLHITIFLLALRKAKPNLIQTINNYLNTVTLESIASVDTQENPLLRPLYGPAIKQFIDPLIPWTDVLYRTFAFLILRREVTNQGNVVENIQDIILGNSSEDASRTITFIEDAFTIDLQIIGVISKVYPPITPDDDSTLNADFDQNNLISIVSATECTTPMQPDNHHFKSYVKMHDIWFEVDALHGSIGNFQSRQIQWSDIVDRYNCENIFNEHRVMYTILYEPVPVPVPVPVPAPVPAPVPVPVPTTTETVKNKPSLFFETIIDQLPEKPNKGYINLLNIAFTRYNKNQGFSTSNQLNLEKFRPTKDKNYSPITNGTKYAQFQTDINALYEKVREERPTIEVTPAQVEEKKIWGRWWGGSKPVSMIGGKKTRKARPLQKKPVKSNRSRSRNRNSKKRIR
jgi:hypothetical protein